MKDDVMENNVHTEKKSPDKWGNEDNASYYENFPVEDFRKVAIRGGFEDGCDIDLIYHYLQDKKTLLDVGAGYGRAIHHLIKNGYTGKIFAIERSENFYNHLIKTFKDVATLIHGDINNFNPEMKFEAVLWMWSNISEWPKNQQADMLKKLADLCSEGGVVILDTIFYDGKPLNVTTYDSQTYIAKSDYGRYAYGYIPTKEEIKEYAAIAKLDIITQIDYTTTTDRKRILHVLKK
jgi:SAM-dependent methyltransferase